MSARRAGDPPRPARERRARDRPDHERPDRERAELGRQVEGRQAVRELLVAGRRRVDELWVADDVAPAPIVDDILALAAHHHVRMRRVPGIEVQQRARTDTPQGFLALAAPLPTVQLDVLARDPRAFLVALDGVTDPQNLGAVARTAETAGATGLVLPRHRAAGITPAVTKAAAGAVEHLALAIVSGIPAALDRLQRAGVWQRRPRRARRHVDLRARSGRLAVGVGARRGGSGVVASRTRAL